MEEYFSTYDDRTLELKVNDKKILGGGCYIPSDMLGVLEGKLLQKRCFLICLNVLINQKSDVTKV